MSGRARLLICQKRSGKIRRFESKSKKNEHVLILLSSALIQPLLSFREELPAGLEDSWEVK